MTVQRETMEGLIGGVYNYCGMPSEDALSPSIVITVIVDTIQEKRNEMDLTDEGWDLIPYILNVQPQKAEYLIEAPDFGRPFFVETFDQTNPRFRKRRVEHGRYQDGNLFSNSVDFTGQYTAVKHSAEVILFRNIGSPSPHAMVQPVPRQACQYQIWTETLVTDEPDLEDTPNFLRNFFPLIKLESAFLCVGYCGYGDSKVNQIREGLAPKLTRAQDTFEKYVLEEFHATTGNIQAANSSRRRRSGRR